MKKVIWITLLFTTVLFYRQVHGAGLIEDDVHDSQLEVTNSNEGAEEDSQLDVTNSNENIELNKALDAGYTKDQFESIMNMPILDDISNQSQMNELEARTIRMTSDQAKVVNEAKKQLGKPYEWGAKGPNSFDCSGLVQYVYKQAVNMNVPAPTTTQEKLGKEVSLSNLQPGDLLFYGQKGASYHVAIYIGNGQMIYAPQPGQNVKISEMKYYYPQFARRILTGNSSSDGKPIYNSEDKLVSINSSNVVLWNDLDQKIKRQTSEIGNVYNLKGSYTYPNGQIIYSLYNNDGSWAGYCDSKYLMDVKWTSFNKVVIVNKEGYYSYNNFFFSNTKIYTNNYIGSQFTAKGYYVLGNGRKYYSIYDDNDTWRGYLNTNAATTCLYSGTNIVVTFNSASNTTYNDISLMKTRGTINEKSAKVTAKYTLGDGSVVYSLYKNNGSWLGYIDSRFVR